MVSDIEMEELIDQQIMLYTLMQSQVLFKIDLLGEIVTGAQVGVIHASILTPDDILSQLKQIQTEIPNHYKFPANLDLEGAYKILNIAELTCFYKNRSLIFIIRIPLVDSYDFTLYNLISLPVKHENESSYTHIDTNIKYLAISRNYENYVIYDQAHIDKCKQNNEYLLCSGEQTVYNRHEKSICEINLAMKPAELPNSCKIKHDTKIENKFQKLKHKNVWVYSTNQENLVLDCEKEKAGLTIKIEGTGLLSLREDCRAITTNSVLIPIKHITSVNLIDIIPESIISLNISNISISTSDISHVELQKLNITELKSLKGVTHIMKKVDEALNIEANWKEISIMNLIYENEVYVKIMIIGIPGIIILLYCFCNNRKTGNINVTPIIPMTRL
jgi:hypothetical protein